MNIESTDLERLRRRSRVHAALGDPHRLAIVDQLGVSDRSPSELAAIIGIDSNLIAHHLGVLEGLDVVERIPSQGDHRRRYVRLVSPGRSDLSSSDPIEVGRVVFVCRENIARSQLASALWNQRDTGIPATSGGTHPGEHVHPMARRAAKRRGLDLHGAHPKPVPELTRSDLMVTVCDRAHEQLASATDAHHLHWSIPDPVASGDPKAFEVAADALAARIDQLAPSLWSG